MTFQSILAVSSAGLAALYFLRGAYQDLSASSGSSCGKCSSGGCPAARKR
ncbi:hypothetical protein GETHLI_26950 [Geothrix limicola]|uniref:FeoB-associated Cys-rich membrane protein n=1 Tax=Geothrix limicola TaxID=2927978 RepID=A0ABQ5QI09_9BACT|nr:hypothetical protein [Geothrix limicola]GLH74193.1 hypothetical protein GETHLI_26950 [Geothrix limicola]